MPPENPSDDNPGTVDARAVRFHFARAAATYDAAAVLQREIGRRMAEKLDVVKLVPAVILDAGCGTGDALADLALRYPDARLVALDVALPMLAAARAKAAERRSTLSRLLSALSGGAGGNVGYVCADVGRLPFAAGTYLYIAQVVGMSALHDRHHQPTQWGRLAWSLAGAAIMLVFAACQ